MKIFSWEVIIMQTEINFKQLGKRVVAKRTERNLMQKDLAEMLGIAVNHLSDIERGVKRPSLELLMRISSFFDTSVDYFLMDQPHACRSYAINEELATILQQCSPESLKLIYQLAKGMLEYQDSIIHNEE